jgi:two-component system OmpR family sensor kinase
MRTIKQQLLIWLLSGMLAITVLVGFAAYFQIQEEANELFDYQLEQVAGSFPGQVAAATSDTEDENPIEDVVVQVWDANGHLVYDSQPQLALTPLGTDGFANVAVAGKPWREYRATVGSRVVLVGQPVAVRQGIATSLAVRSAVPFLLLIPALGLLIGIAVSRSLHPLQVLVNAIRRRSHNSLEPLRLHGISPEIQPTVDALNDLLTRLAHESAVQQQFLADAAHELRTPLTALSLQVQLAERATNEAQRRTAFAKLQPRLSRAMRLVEQLLALARQEPPEGVWSTEPVSLGQLTETVLEDLRSAAEEKRILLRAEILDPGMVLDAQPDDLRVLIENLLHNAIRYTQAGGEVVVVVKLDGGQPTLTVSDNGPGIPAEERPRVLNRFYRRTGTGETGSGLGLTIAESIARRHGSQLVLEDGLTGQGLGVKVVFPAVNPTDAVP